jgi:hypothetical protein
VSAVRDDAGPVSIHVHQSGYNENEREQEYRSASHND